MKKIFILVISLLVLPICAKAYEVDLAPNAKSAILIEVSTGKVIFEKNSNERYAPASMTKMMSMLLFLEAIEKGIMTWEENITISANASSMGGSQILLETGEVMSVHDLFKGVSVASGNDATVALAERVAGTEEAFVNKMNEKAKALGLTNTHFVNCTGLDTEGHYSTAHDMMVIAKELVSHEKIFEFSSIYEDYLREGTDRKFWLVNTNKLVRFYNGADGLKTGYTDNAGYCLTATAKRNEMRLLGVIMNEENSNIRNQEMMAMLDYGFNQYEIEKVLTVKSKVDTITIEKAKKQEVDIIPTSDITLLHKKTEEKANVTFEIKLNDLKPPIKKGQIIGQIVIKEDNNTSRIENLTVAEDVEKANILNLFVRHLNNILIGNISF